MFPTQETFHSDKRTPCLSIVFMGKPQTADDGVAHSTSRNGKVTLADKGFAAMELDCVWRINPSMVIKGNRRKEKVLADEFAAIQKEYDEKRKFRKNGKKREEAAGKEKAAA